MIKVRVIKRQPISVRVKTEIVYGNAPPDYEGTYEVVPKFEDQELNTENKLLRRDITVKKISLESVSNQSGGRTVIIGG